MDTTLFIAICILVLIYGIRATRRKAIRLQEADSIQASVERVSANYAHVDRPNEDETTPPSEPLADETYTPQEPTIWDIEIEKYFTEIEE